MSMCPLIFLTFPKDSMKCLTISGYVCGVQLSFEPKSRAFHLSLLYYVFLPQILLGHLHDVSTKLFTGN